MGGRAEADNALVLLSRARELQGVLTTLRRILHAHPELSYEEEKTADRCAAIMALAGYRIRRPIAKTGFAADAGTGGPLIVIRAEMDALPIQTSLTTEYASLVPGVMHACGHDAHMAIALGSAFLLSELHEEGILDARIRFLFQPAEEFGDEDGKTGGRHMVEEGEVDGALAVLAQHGMPDLPAGKVAVLNGPVMAASLSFEVTILGNGGHIAEPEQTIDTVLVASAIRMHIAEDLERLGLAGTVVIGIGAVIPDTQVANIIPKEVKLRGSIRTLSRIHQTRCEEVLAKACRAAVAKYGGKFELKYLSETPCTANDHHVSATMRSAAQSVLGAEQIVTDSKPRFTAEDFAWYGSVAPSAFMLTGTGHPDRPSKLHASNYDFPEDVLPLAAAVLAQTAYLLALRQ